MNKRKCKETVDPGCPFIEVNNKDVLQKIMKYLCAIDVVTLGSTCQKMRTLSNSESVWFHLLKRDYGVEKDTIMDGNTSNKEIYKQEKQFEEMLKNNNLGLEKENFCFSCTKGLIHVKCCIRRGARTSLIYATSNGYKEVVELLVNKGANIDQVNDVGQTALINAAWNGHTPVVELLLNKGANIDQVDNDGRTALMLAAASHHTKIVELLLNKGANIDQVDNIGRTALMCASLYGHTSVVELLLNKGANIDQVSNYGWTALMLASRYGHNKEVVELLLNKGAKIDQIDNDGYTEGAFI